MTKFEVHHGVVSALIRDNIDTDVIIPSREIKAVAKSGLGRGLFAGWRYLDPNSREENPDFVLNRPQQRNTSILLTGENFGCGSSREHAVWALAEYGIRVVIAPSFGSIFFSNCVRNGLLPVVLDKRTVEAIALETINDPQKQLLEVSLLQMTVTTAQGHCHQFALEPLAREMLLKGLDPIALTLENIEQIEAFQLNDRQIRPWAYLSR
ncbi:3-isopropylmalate dehydratase small subunit [Denitratisoma oestradiolicum]|uniref:3-isopropylmalate dehydratase small subunit n=1 Tax=Denitratisoma oestradiolicum TaxID=311182 RepID=A0A6S6XZH2_9PROT|nr:3-isopropylmalate dehydratase small subunit [Denitratisoma oestradiolicum]TWO79163.1 3-isopropylmalate dehydratase small subunit [Denitratisoma oestradiolicum]CAB1369581.1 3-isopropylmalate isomerase subunit [Denitratisoma oestradiolicum]